MSRGDERRGAKQAGATATARAADPVQASTAEPTAGAAEAAEPDRSIEERILLLLPFGRDADLAAAELSKAGLEAVGCRDLKSLVTRLDEGAGVALLGEEALRRGASRLFRVFDRQQTWSDLPVIVLLRKDGPNPESLAVLRAFERHPKIKTTFLQRPVPALSLVSSVRASLKSRLRQYQVRDLLAQLNEDVRLRDEFLAMLGHELRNPVSSIGYVSDLFEMEGSALTQERAGWGATVIGRQVRHLGRLLDQLLDVARVQRGKIALEVETLDLRSVAEDCADSARVAGEDREWSVGLPDCAVWVEADRVRLSQIVDNLLENALKYTGPGGRIEVKVRADGPSAVLAVADDGRGMNKSALNHVFKPFFQETAQRTAGSAGLGLGLAMVDNLVRLHGGTITASSEGEGRGSRFELRLPRAAGVEADRGERTARREREGEPLRLLVVEDNVEVAELFALLLKSLGHEAHVAHEGLEAVETARELGPDVAFIDIGLPDIDGAEVARRLRAAPRAPRLVALTGFAEESDGEDSPFDEYLLKPVSRSQVEDLLQRLA